MMRLGFILSFIAALLIGSPVYADGIINGGGSGTTLTPGQLPGTATNDNASAGNVGEWLTNNGTVASIANNTQTNVTSQALTAGDWNVQCTFYYVPASTTTTTLVVGSLSPTSATNNLVVGFYGVQTYPSGTVLANPTQGPSLSNPVMRVSLASTTTYYCVGFTLFGTSTMAVTAILTARRAR